MFNLRTVPGLLFTFVICSVTTLLADFCYATLPPPLLHMHEWPAAWRGRCRVVQTGSWSGILLPSSQARKYFLKACVQSEWKYFCAADAIRDHRKKSFSIFPSPAGMSLTKLSLGENKFIYDVIIPPRESLVRDIPAGDGNIEKLFLRCTKQRFATIPELLQGEWATRKMLLCKQSIWG